MFDKKLVIISNYPNSDEIKDGMMQRVANIDDYLLDYDRSYLQIGIKNNFRKYVKQEKHNMIKYKFNFLIHYFSSFASC